MTARAGQRFQARRAGSWFFKHWTEDCEGGRSAGSPFHFVLAMTRNADHRAGGRLKLGTQPKNRTRFFRRNIIRTQVDPVSPRSDGDVSAGIDKQPSLCSCVAYSPHGIVRNDFQFARRQVFLSKLDKIHTMGRRLSDVGQKRGTACSFVP